MKDFNIRPLREEIRPLVLRIYQPFYRQLYIRYNTYDPGELLAYLPEMQSKLYPGLPFYHSFLDQEFDQIYEVEYRTGRIIISFIIASPMAYYFTRKWLREFAFGINISPLTYLFSLISVMVIAFLTIGFLSRKSARVNPAQTLKHN